MASERKRTVLVTGAGSGLGHDYAFAFARKGDTVALVDIDRAAVQRAAEDIGAAGGTALALAGDVRDAQGMAEAVETVLSQFGRIDAVVCNAGILRDRSFAKMPLEDFRLLVDVHVFGTVNVLKPVWDIMREQRFGRVLVTSSTSALYGNFGQANYDSAKLALVGLMKCLAIEGAGRNILVNAIAPIAYTPLGAGTFPESSKQVLSTDYVSDLVLFLCSSRNETINGEIFEVGAGRIARAAILRNEGVRVASPPDDLAGQLHRLLRTTPDILPENATAAIAQHFSHLDQF